MIGAFWFIPLDVIFTVSVADSAETSIPAPDIVMTFWLLSLIVIFAPDPAPLITMVWITAPSRLLLRIVTVGADCVASSSTWLPARSVRVTVAVLPAVLG